MRKVTSNVVAVLAIMFVVMLSTSGLVSALQVFYDDFSGTLGDWNVLSGSWSIENEELCQSVVYCSYDFGLIAINDLDLRDLSVEADVKFMELRPSHWAYAGFAVRYADENAFYWIVLKQTADEDGLPNLNLRLELRAQLNYLVVVDLGFVGELGHSYNLKVEVEGSAFKVYVDNDLQIETVNTTFGNSGSILMWTGRCSACFDNVLVHNPGSINVVPEPATVIILGLSIAALATYMLIRKRPSNKAMIKP